MRKIYRRLTKEQIKRGVIFSSCLSVYKTEQEEDRIHEVFKIEVNDFKNKPAYELIKVQEEQQKLINNLKDDKFFFDSKFNYNIIRR